MKRTDLLTSGIYAIVHKQSGTVYLGSTQNFGERWKWHLRDLHSNRHYNTYLQRAWNKYGMEAFEFVILQICPIDLLLKEEDKWLAQTEHKYNLCPTATGRTAGIKWHHTPETKALLRMQQTGRTRSQEQCARLGASTKRYWADPTHKARRIRAISAALKGRPVSLERRERIRQAVKRAWTRPGFRERMSKALTGRKMTFLRPNTPFKGRKHSAESKAKIGAKNSVHRKGKPISEAAKAKIRATLTGRPRTAETIAKMRATWAMKRRG